MASATTSWVSFFIKIGKYIENNNKITIKEIVAILKKLNINIRSVDLETYNKEIARNFQNKNELIGLLENDIENCNVNSEKSTNYLKELGFEKNGNNPGK